MMPSIGINVRVTGHCSQGGRKYMEDMFSVAYQQTEDERDLEYAFFGIFDGHGGLEAATFAKEHLLDNIVSQRCFWSDKDDDVLRAIREGFLQTHLAMWRQLEHWPKTAIGLPSTSGTTASIAFIRRGKIYIGHVGDSSIVLGYQKGNDSWEGCPLTQDHKPESEDEIQRIEKSGGKVIKKSGVSRVVWNRPSLDHQGPITRSTRIDEIPFLAIARSLGDLWSYNPALDVFVVSPEPDVMVHNIDVSCHRCLIFGTDGLWNVVSHNAAVRVVQAVEMYNEQHLLQQGNGSTNAWVNPSKSLVDHALEGWQSLGLLADNTSVVTLMLDPPGPPRVQVLLNQRQQQLQNASNVPHSTTLTNSNEKNSTVSESSSSEPISPNGGVAIFTRVCDSSASETRDVLQSCNSSSRLHTSSSTSRCLQSNEVSSSSRGIVSDSTSNKFCDRSVNVEQSHNLPSYQGIKRRHSSIVLPSSTLVEKRKRTKSEHDYPIKSLGKDEDSRASDTENERTSWPPWNTSRTDGTKPLCLTAKNNLHISDSKTVKSTQTFLPASSENTSETYARVVHSDDLPRWTLRSHNIRSSSTSTCNSERVRPAGLPQSGCLPAAQRHKCSRWPQQVAKSMVTRSQGKHVSHISRPK